MKKRVSSLLLLLLACLGTAAATDASLKEYVNDHYGFVLRYPPQLITGKERADGSGREFHTADGKFHVVAFAEPLSGRPDEAIAHRFAQEVQLFGRDVTYRTKGDHWLVVSGVGAKGIEFYSKAYASGTSVTLFRITYPHSENRIYDPWVTRIEKNFVSAHGASEQAKLDGRRTAASPPNPSPARVRSTTSASGTTSAPRQPTALPTARQVPGKPGFVYSPYNPDGGYVDVTGFASGTEAKDPYSGKIFIVP